jgi:hypothetical protein
VRMDIDSRLAVVRRPPTGTLGQQGSARALKLARILGDAVCRWEFPPTLVVFVIPGNWAGGN